MEGHGTVSQYSLLDNAVTLDSEVFFFSFRILSFTGSPDSILTVLVITRLTTSQTGPLHPAGLPSASGRQTCRPELEGP